MEERIVYVAADGNSFNSREDCVEYEYIYERLEGLRQGIAEPLGDQFSIEDLFEWMPVLPSNGEARLKWARQLKAVAEYLYDAELS